MFFSCSFTYSVWQLLYNWLTINTVLPLHLIHHFNNHMGLPSLKNRSKHWSTIWLTTIWSIWLSRNNIIFKNTKPSLQHILDTANVKSWLWINSKDENDTFSYSYWLSLPLVCLNTNL
ncbi:unnamed protein product [Lupinus luteus]|uniref:Uncharacterized protein n=1 Tax=Lupinus luteus TaxID=3873 RepID=A0AAV1WMM3_LUPLU